jgi:hypothetical protein
MPDPRLLTLIGPPQGFASGPPNNSDKKHNNWNKATDYRRKSPVCLYIKVDFIELRVLKVHISTVRGKAEERRAAEAVVHCPG